ncbi:hypothetical protein IEQ34_006401 [Dendrobium chrysotoxum]|uniref:Secreted protein n=1 Tax=Dendrobium chrysotoxum TaxID=161865 RepID=A0AAV7HFC7_DENCH|nr:hypothetical protein IEQ34_006401 [Dendrobium chrysotoxum]
MRKARAVTIMAVSLCSGFPSLFAAPFKRARFAAAVSRFPAEIAVAVSRSICLEEVIEEDEDEEDEEVGELDRGFCGKMSFCIVSFHSLFVTAEPSETLNSSSSSSRSCLSSCRSRFVIVDFFSGSTEVGAGNDQDVNFKFPCPRSGIEADDKDD